MKTQKMNVTKKLTNFRNWKITNISAIYAGGDHSDDDLDGPWGGGGDNDQGNGTGGNGGA